MMRKRSSPVGASAFGSITAPQRAMLALFDDGLAEDAVGREAEMLNSHLIAVCERLVGKDLVPLRRRLALLVLVPVDTGGTRDTRLVARGIRLGLSGRH